MKRLLIGSALAFAMVLTAIGLAFVLGQHALSRKGGLARVAGSGMARALPALSAAATSIAGVVIAVAAARGFA